MLQIATTRKTRRATWKSLHASILMTLAALTAACDSATMSPIAEVPEAVVAEIQIQPAEATLFSGESTLLSAVVTGSDGTALTSSSGAPTIAWSTEAADVVSVTGSGLVTGTGLGFTEVHATAGGMEATAFVIIQPEAPGLRVEENGSEYEGVVGVGPPDSVAVRVLQQDGSALAGVTVRIVPEPGSGTVSPSLTVTDSEGFARTEWTMGTTAGPQELVATIPLPGGEGASGASDGNAPQGTTAGSTNPAGRLRGWAKAAAPAELSVSPETATTQIQGTFQFQAEVRDQHGNVLDDASVTWTSQGPEVASVSGTGLSTGIAEGTTTIEAEVNGVTGSAVLTVQSADDDSTPSTPSSVSVSPEAATTEIGGTFQFQAEVRDQNGTVLNDVSVTWTSQTAGVASVNETGLSTGIAEGTTTIEAEVNGVTGSAVLTVQSVDDDSTPSTPSSVSVSPEAATTEIGGTFQFQAEVRDQNGTVMNDVSVTWTSQTAGVASVNGTGLSTGIAGGTTTIEAEVNGVTGSAVLTVQSADDDPPGDDDPPPSEPAAPGTVTDLRTTSSSNSSVSLAFTEVDDGTGSPAHYRVRYATSASNAVWPGGYTTVTEGACAEPAEGAQVGATFTCQVPGLGSGTSYDFRLIAYRYDDAGARVFGSPSNIAIGETDGSATPPSAGVGIWMDPSALAALPTSGPAWDNVKAMADEACPTFNLSDQDNRNNTCVMANALVYARTGQVSYLSEIMEALTALANMGTYSGRALAMGRNLGTYAIVADLIDLPTLNPSLDAALRTKFRELLTTYTTGAASSLVDCHENRPNNWGAHCGGSRAAVAVYLGDTAELARTAQVFRGFLGERSSYTGFTFGGPSDSRDHSWECDESAPVGINPRDCMKGGRNLGGVIPDDQRRGGSFDPDSWPPPKELYVWEALQGIMMQAVILRQAGYDPFEWGDRAILRAVTFLHDVVDFPADRGNTWQPHIVNRYYGTSFPAPVPSRYGKNVGWTDWTHGGN
jgi:hypothetical protein